MFGKRFWISFLFLSVFIWSISCVTNRTSDAEKNYCQQDSIELKGTFYAVGLVYHRFEDDRYPSTNTSRIQFEEHLKYLNNNGFVSYVASDIINHQEHNEKKVMVTIDDGFKSFYKNGWPLLKKYRCKATIFINTESVGWKDYLSWREIRDLYCDGIEIGAHSHEHSYFLNYSDSIREKVFSRDLDVSEKLFKDSLGFVPKVYAYPYGEFDKHMVSLLKKRGYMLAFAQNSGVWCNDNSLFAIPRFPMSGSHLSLEQFVQKVNMKPLRLRGDVKFPVQLNGNEPFVFKMLLDSIDNYQGLNCFFNNNPANDLLTISSDTILSKITMPVNKRRVIFTITTKDRNNNWYWWSHLFVNPTVN